MRSFRRLLLPVICALCALPALVQAQGAWIPPNADLSYPRTLLKAPEVPAMQAYLGLPEAHGLYTRMWNGVQSYNPGNFQNNSGRRLGAHNAKNAAFIYLLDRKPAGTGLDTLTDAEAADLLGLALVLFDSINTTVEAYPDFGNYLWRSNELTDNLIAFDLLKGAGVPDSLLAPARAKLQLYAGNLHAEVAFDLFNLGFFSLHVDNHALRSAGALALAAVVLNDATSGNPDQQPVSWLNTGLFHIDNVLWRDALSQSASGGIAGYAEGPHYLRFGMKHVLPFMHALGNFLPDTTLSVTFDGTTRSVRHPWYDPAYDNLFEWVMRIRMPDGRSPALEDCFIATCYPELAIRENPEFRGGLHFSRWHPVTPNSLWEQLHHSSDDVVADFLASRTQPAPVDYPRMQVLRESGNLIFRSGWDSTSTYLHITAKNGRARNAAKGHNHADVTSFILHAKGQHLALDAGYLRWDRRDEVSEAPSHNMILADGQGPPDGSLAGAGDADGFIEHDFALTHLDYAEVRTNYASADIVRKPLFVRGSYFLIADEVGSAQAHDYQWRLHGYGLEGGDSIHGTFDFLPSDDRGIWTKNGVRLLAQVTASGGIDQYGRETNVHELKYDSIETHTTLLAEKQNTADAAFLVLLEAFGQDTPAVRTLCAPDCGVLTREGDGFRDFAFTSGQVSASGSGLSGDLLTDAWLCFYSEDTAGGFAQFFLDGGSRLLFGTDTLASATQAVDLAFQVLDSVNHEGYCGGAATVRLFDLGYVPGSVLGANVSGWSYSPADAALTIVFSGPGEFTVHEDVIIGGGGGARPFGLVLYPNPAGDHVRIRVRNADGIELRDVRGALVRQWPVTAGEMVLDLRGCAAGTYFIRAVSGEKVMAVEKMLVR